MSTENKPKQADKYVCKLCDFSSCKISNYESHLTTTKHQKNASGNSLASICQQEKKFLCTCGKDYLDRTGLWKHKKKCVLINCDDKKTSQEQSNVNDEILKKDSLENNKLVEYLMNENKEFKNLIMELIKKDTINSNITNNTNINSNNSFNLQVFLNDKCKGAMNMSEFVDTIKVQLSDLENFAHVDYADGVSKILLKNLNNLDTYLRPIHCSDSKREIIYIKENNCWTKEEDDKPSLKTAIKQVAFKNIKQINEWVKENPGCQDPRTKQNVKYNKIVMNSMSGGTIEEQHDNIEKIIKNVTKAVTIDKNALK